ncbi:hypothetical protein BKA62DRAFT_764530 [Auriculariales sp. MPI-PUGE-AT-0066]|nr:hypothetical protein BKA62DRAFT_764530 [Auriculariales sp. MPI-PUGE-AT-0066]
MSLTTTAARRSALALRRAAASGAAARRFASSQAHDDHHHDDHGHGHEDTNVYPREGFSAPIWRNFVIITILGVGVANFLPDNWREDNFILRGWRMHGYMDPVVWGERNKRHLEQTADEARLRLISEGAWRPIKKQWRYQGYLDEHHGSPNCIPVGSQVVAKHY